MNNHEKLQKMKGTREDKIELLNMFMNSLMNGETLEDGDYVMLEFLKKDLINKQVVDMSATVTGVGGVDE